MESLSREQILDASCCILDDFRVLGAIAEGGWIRASQLRDAMCDRLGIPAPDVVPLLQRATELFEVQLRLEPPDYTPVYWVRRSVSHGISPYAVKDPDACRVVELILKTSKHSLDGDRDGWVPLSVLSQRLKSRLGRGCHGGNLRSTLTNCKNPIFEIRDARDSTHFVWVRLQPISKQVVLPPHVRIELLDVAKKFLQKYSQTSTNKFIPTSQLGSEVKKITGKSFCGLLTESLQGDDRFLLSDNGKMVSLSCWCTGTGTDHGTSLPGYPGFGFQCDNNNTTESPSINGNNGNGNNIIGGGLIDSPTTITPVDGLISYNNTITSSYNSINTNSTVTNAYNSNSRLNNNLTNLTTNNNNNKSDISHSLVSLPDPRLNTAYEILGFENHNSRWISLSNLASFILQNTGKQFGFGFLSALQSDPRFKLQLKDTVWYVKRRILNNNNNNNRSLKMDNTNTMDMDNNNINTKINLNPEIGGGGGDNSTLENEEEEEEEGLEEEKSASEEIKKNNNKDIEFFDIESEEEEDIKMEKNIQKEEDSYEEKKEDIKIIDEKNMCRNEKNVSSVSHGIKDEHKSHDSIFSRLTKVMHHYYR